MKIWYLCKRTVRITVLSKKLFVMFNVQLLFTLILTFIIYKNLTQDYGTIMQPNQINLLNRFGSYFFITINVYIAILLNSAFKMEEENQIIYKELSNDMYGKGSYFWSKSLIDLMVILIPIMAQTYPVQFG